MSLSLDTKGSLTFKGSTGFAQTISASAPTANRAITIPDPGFDCNLLMNRVPTAAAGATRAIAVTESGSVLTVSAAAARVFTLPAVATSAGFRCRFVVGTAGANTITISAPAAILQGVVTVGAAGAASHVVSLNQTSIIFANNQSLGAWVEINCDGTNYYVSGASGIAAGFTTA